MQLFHHYYLMKLNFMDWVAIAFSTHRTIVAKRAGFEATALLFWSRIHALLHRGTAYYDMRSERPCWCSHSIQCCILSRNPLRFKTSRPTGRKECGMPMKKFLKVDESDRWSLTQMETTVLMIRQNSLALHAVRHVALAPALDRILSVIMEAWFAALIIRL